MKHVTRIAALLTIACQSAVLSCRAQSVSNASFLSPQQKADVTIPYRFTDAGEQTPIEWGLDLAWLSETNVRTGVLFVGKDMIDVVRLSFQPLASVEDGEFSDEQTTALTNRFNIVQNWLNRDVGVYINCDQEAGIDDWYNDASVSSTVRGQRWAKVIDMTADWYKSQGLTNLVALQGFNEPDYGWNQGASGYTQEDMKNIFRSFREDDEYADKYASVRMCGPNTLNPDYGVSWFNAMSPYLDEGNTHQLAGTFDNYATFFETLRSGGYHATADELHNVMECMVGAEYGMQTGIWWGTNERTRSLFMEATWQGNPGDRLGYGEHRDNWTSASVYRLPAGQTASAGTVQAFGGMSERQSYTTYYDFAALDRPVWYDGERGRLYTMYLPGGTGYQTGQTSAEVAVQVQSGADVMPHLEAGTYKIVNVNSGKVLGFSAKPTSGWTSVAQRNNSNTYKFLQWVITPLQSSGDFSYWSLVLNTDNDMYLDLKDWNYEDGADVGVYPGGGNTVEQWCIEYADMGSFYIRSRYSNKCLEVEDSKTTSGANVQCNSFTGADNQKWRFIATNVTPDQVAPAAPSGLTATAQQSSVKLEWTANSDKDILEYVVLRDGYVLAKGLTETTFVDNEAEPDSTYSYSVYAIDKSLNYGTACSAVSASVTDEEGCVAYLPLESSLSDQSENANHAATYGDASFVTRSSSTGLDFSGDSTYVQLPYTIANHKALSVSCWFYYRGGSEWQRIWDFGNGTDQYMFLTSNYGSGLRFAIKNGGDEEQVTPGKRLTSNKWFHLVVTLDGNTASLYLDGELIGQNTSMTISPADFRPTLNYIGRSQFAADPLLKGTVHDFQVFNYALSAEEIASINTAVERVEAETPETEEQAYDLSGQKATSRTRLHIYKGKKVVE